MSRYVVYRHTYPPGGGSVSRAEEYSDALAATQALRAADRGPGVGDAYAAEEHDGTARYLLWRSADSPRDRDRRPVDTERWEATQKVALALEVYDRGASRSEREAIGLRLLLTAMTRRVRLSQVEALALDAIWDALEGGTVDSRRQARDAAHRVLDGGQLEASP